MQEQAVQLQGCLLVLEGILVDHHHHQLGIIVIHGKKTAIAPHLTIMAVTSGHNMVGMIHHAVEKMVVVVNRIFGGAVTMILDHIMIIGTNIIDAMIMIGHFPEAMEEIGSMNITTMMMVDGGENKI